MKNSSDRLNPSGIPLVNHIIQMRPQECLSPLDLTKWKSILFRAKTVCVTGPITAFEVCLQSAINSMFVEPHSAFRSLMGATSSYHVPAKSSVSRIIISGPLSATRNISV